MGINEEGNFPLKTGVKRMFQLSIRCMLVSKLTKHPRQLPIRNCRRASFSRPCYPSISLIQLKP